MELKEQLESIALRNEALSIKRTLENLYHKNKLTTGSHK